MIPIKIINVHRKASKHAKLMHTYLKKYKRGKPLSDINSWLSKVFGPKEDYYTILMADPDKMQMLARKFVSSGAALDPALENLKNIYKNFRSPSKTPIMLPNGTKYDGFAFAALLDVSVCPYCNRNYIISLKNSGIATCELDHFYNKDKYSFFALSFYNLIPACKTCNHIKHSKNGNYYNPHSKKHNDSSLLKFSVKLTGTNFLDRIADLKLQYDYHSDFKDTFVDLKLGEVYDFHIDYVQDIIKKKHLYSEEYLEQLMNDYGGKLFKSREELLGLLLPGYVSEDKLGLRPFSKLSKDIWEQLSVLY